mmetsp:Transcript_14276/g.53740  ORF Transcript_14276/g.53740 Transcript_14276/m.53740 type:complete len:273 (+) Transcript_14276:1028-1846(+)
MLELLDLCELPIKPRPRAEAENVVPDVLSEVFREALDAAILQNHHRNHSVLEGALGVLEALRMGSPHAGLDDDVAAVQPGRLVAFSLQRREPDAHEASAGRMQRSLSIFAQLIAERTDQDTTWSQKALEELGGVRVHSRSDVDAVIQYIVVDVKLERISPREAHRGTGVCGAEFVRQGLRRLRQHRTELDSVTCRRRSQDPGHDGTEVSTPRADVEEAQSRTQLQLLRHSRIDVRSAQMHHWRHEHVVIDIGLEALAHRIVLIGFPRRNGTA